ncbi:hypothetical protein GOV07_04925 [Candidatus Woesearchaeota archaeon]|nr:hypothetical protein [Candidatus Woesearchaeota archaeon]
MRVTKGCPLCQGDVLGTGETGFYCKSCNLMFRKQHVEYKHLKREAKLLIQKHFSGHIVEREEVTVFEDEPLTKVSVPSPEYLDKVASTIEKNVELLKSTLPPLDVAKDQLEWPVLGKKSSPKQKTPKPKKVTKKPAPKKKTTKSSKTPKKSSKKTSKKSTNNESTKGLENML